MQTNRQFETVSSERERVRKPVRQISARRTIGGCAAALLALLSAAPTPVQAQVSADSIRRRNECRLAEQVIRTGNPRPRMRWSWQTIGLCDTATQLTAYRAAMQRARISTDLDFVRMALMRAATYQDAETFALSIEIAGDRTATVEARVMAFVALAAIRDPWAAPDYDGFVGGTGRAWASSRRVLHALDASRFVRRRT